MNEVDFFDEFNAGNFAAAMTVLSKQPENVQQKILQQLFYQAREAKQPIAIGLLYRKLHADKNFQDFYQAWLPPTERTHPFTVGDKIYHQFFDLPTRVIHAINVEDPSEVVSIGMTWGDEQQFIDGLNKATKDNANLQRRDTISQVADKVSSKIYKVTADVQLGT